MSTYTFSTNSGFATNDNITLINSDIDSQILTRTNTEIMGDSIAVTFSNPLSESEVLILQTIINTRDIPIVKRGDKIVTLWPNVITKSSIFQISALIPYKSWKITHVEINSSMDIGLTSYTVRLYDPTLDAVLCEATFNNTEDAINDLGPISNLPQNDTQLEFQAKVTGGKIATYINSIIIYYTN